MTPETYCHKRTGARVQIVGKRLHSERGLLYVTLAGLTVESEQFLQHFEREA